MFSTSFVLEIKFKLAIKGDIMRVKKRFVLLAVIFVLFSSSFALSDTVNFQMNNTSLLGSLGYVNGIQGFILNFEGLTSASFAAGSTISGWFTQDTDDKPVAGVTQAEGADLYGGSPMGDGIFGTLTYAGSISWSDTYPLTNPVGWEFRTASPNVIIPEIMLTSNNLVNGGTVEWTVVPIPSTILLLGGGLAALVGLRRRKSS
jgi:hypothetical protein